MGVHQENIVGPFLRCTYMFIMLLILPHIP